MAGLGARLFPAFSKLTAAQVNGYLMDQTIMRFASVAARDAAFGGVGEPTLAEGMTCYLDDTNVLQSYNGTTWNDIASSDGKYPRGVVANIVRTTAVASLGTTTADVTGMSVSFTAVSSRFYRFSFYISGQKISTADYTDIQLADSSNNVIAASTSYAVAGNYWNCAGGVVKTGLTGSVTYKLRGSCGSGTSNPTAYGTQPLTLVVEDIGVL